MTAKTIFTEARLGLARRIATVGFAALAAAGVLSGCERRPATPNGTSPTTPSTTPGGGTSSGTGGTSSGTSTTTPSTAPSPPASAASR